MGMYLTGTHELRLAFQSKSASLAHALSGHNALCGALEVKLGRRHVVFNRRCAKAVGAGPRGREGIQQADALAGIGHAAIA